jgi:hypothetical protein
MKTSLGPDLATTEARLGHGKRPRPRGAGVGGCAGQRPRLGGGGAGGCNGGCD